MEQAESTQLQGSSLQLSARSYLLPDTVHRLLIRAHCDIEKEEQDAVLGPHRPAPAGQLTQLAVFELYEQSGLFVQATESKMKEHVTTVPGD